MGPRGAKTSAALAALAVAVTGAASCGAPARPTADATPGLTSRTGPSTTPTGLGRPQPSPTAVTTPPDAAQAALARMSLAQQVGQLVMVGGSATGVSEATLDAISQRHVGNAMLTGRSTLGAAATARVSARLQARATRAATAAVPLLVATDQEGGAVQVLQGAGFSRIPTASQQGRWPPSTLQTQARAWGAQLRRAGVRVDLAPVADTVPPGTDDANPPIGRFERDFAHDPQAVADDVEAFVRGMTSAGVLTTVKHFPGLGRVDANTDTTAGVTDAVTGRTSPELDPWRRAIAAGASAVMMSSAIYPRLDPSGPAAFSRTVITDVLRGDLGFGGVVISDDLGRARQVQRWSAGSRATQFVAAGGDLVLTVDPRQAAPMVDALLARARSSATFRAQVRASALRVLRAKQSLGLLG